MRSRPLFVSRVPQYQYYTVNPLDRAMSAANQYFHCIDPFIGSLNSFLSSLNRHVKYFHADNYSLTVLTQFTNYVCLRINSQTLSFH